MSNVITGASFNILKHLSDVRTEDDLSDLIRQKNLSFAGLQEINWNVKSEHLDGWEVYQPDASYVRKDPIIYDPNVWTVAAKGYKTLSARTVDEDGRVFPERNAVWVVLEGDLGRIVVVNVHLHSSVEEPAGVPNGSIQQIKHYQGLRVLGDTANSLEFLYECPVVIVGDFNVDYGSDKKIKHLEFPYRQLTSIGYECVWELGEQSTRRKHPWGGRTIDQAWIKSGEFVHVRTPNRWSRLDLTESDHLPVIFQFTIDTL